MTRIAAALLSVSLAAVPADLAAQTTVPSPPAIPTAPLPPAPPEAPLPVSPEAVMPPMAPLPAPAPLPSPWHSSIDMDVALPFHLGPLPDFSFDFDFPMHLENLENLDVTLPAHIEAQAMQYAQAIDQAEVERLVERANRQVAALEVRARGDAYNAGLNALQRSQYEQAVDLFERVVAAGAPRADAALYWKAFAEFRLARMDAARQTLGQLRKQYAQSRYLSDAQILETEVREQSGQPVDPAQLDNDEIKLLAIQGLERTAQVVPLLEGVLDAPNSLNVKRRALYVLALREDPGARDVLLRYAKGAGNPDLQLEGVRLLVSRRDAQTTDAVLRDIYETSPDATVRRVIIDAYRRRQSTRPGSTSPQAAAELAALYEHEGDADLRRHIASVLVSMGAIDQVAAAIRSERDTRARERLVSTLGARNNAGAARALTDLYGTFSDVETREAILSALANQQNADALIALARTETNRTLKTHIVRHLSNMAPRSPAAAAYLMDVIK